MLIALPHYFGKIVRMSAGEFGIVYVTPKLDMRGLLQETTSRPSEMLQISEDILFSLSEGKTSERIMPGRSCEMILPLDETNVHIAQAIMLRNFTLKSTLAISGGAIPQTKFCRIQGDLSTGRKNLVISVENTGPVPLIMPEQYPLLRVFDRPEVPLRGEELLLRAEEMGDPDYIQLRTKDGLTRTITQIKQERKNGTLPKVLFESGEEAFDRVVMKYVPKIGRINRPSEAEINLAKVRNRANGLLDDLEIEWVPVDSVLPPDQRVLLQITQESIAIPEGYMAIIIQEGDIRRDEIPHCDSVGLDGGREWPIVGEHTIPTTRRWKKPEEMVVHLYEKAV